MKKKKLKPKNKKKEPFCKNCALYDWHNQHCKVVVLYEGEKMNPPTSPEDRCIFDQTYLSVNEKGNKEIWKPELQQVRWFMDGNGVKIEYPEGFFGKEEN